MTLPRIGILGGMGPAATILLQQRVLEATKAIADDGHIPMLIDMNTQVPSRIEYLIHGRGESPGPVLASMARDLESNGVDVIAMPCCTAHHFADEIVKSVSIPFLDMVKLAGSEIARIVPPGSDVGVLASPANITTKLFTQELRSHGLNDRYPEDRVSILAAIEAIKKSGPSTESIDIVQSAVNELAGLKVSALMLGCSEFSLIVGQLTSEVPIVDSVDVLAQSIVHWDK